MLWGALLTLLLQFSPPLLLPSGIFLSYTNFFHPEEGQDANLGGQVESPVNAGLCPWEHLKPFHTKQRSGILQKFGKSEKCRFIKRNPSSKGATAPRNLPFQTFHWPCEKNRSHQIILLQHFQRNPFPLPAPCDFIFVLKS